MLKKKVVLLSNIDLAKLLSYAKIIVTRCE